MDFSLQLPRVSALCVCEPSGLIRPSEFLNNKWIAPWVRAIDALLSAAVTHVPARRMRAEQKGKEQLQRRRLREDAIDVSNPHHSHPMFSDESPPFLNPSGPRVGEPTIQPVKG